MVCIREKNDNDDDDEGCERKNKIVEINQSAESAEEDRKERLLFYL